MILLRRELLLLFSYSRTIGKTSVHHFPFLTQSAGYFCIYDLRTKLTL